MRAAVTTEAGRFDLVSVPDPAPGPDEIVVRVRACGVCGSDLKAQPFMPADTIMGHEFGGDIVAVGSAAGGWSEGTRVAVLPLISCGRCRSCLAADVAHCEAVRFIGMGEDAGGFAEYAAVPARHAFRLPEEVPPETAALVEPFAVGLHCVVRGEVGPGDHVLVVGAGGVGLTTVAWAAARGAERITAIDPEPIRRGLAEKLGATDALTNAADAERDRYDVAVECVGKPDLLQACESAVRPLGRIVIAGACDAIMPLEPITGLLKELTVRFSVAYRPEEFQMVIDAFAAGNIDPGQVVGQRVGLDRVGEAFGLVQSAQVRGRILVSAECDSGTKGME
jgi:threonine dehydrogenase-like Zn-dependent dehydrogenase